jgi:cytoskeletal protein CcmA (bactofilin family)
MWRKQNEAKPSSPASTTPAPAPMKPQETPQAASEQSAKTSVNTSTNTSAKSAAPAAANISAPPVAEQAKAAPAAPSAPALVSAAPAQSAVTPAVAPPIAPVEPTVARMNGGSSTISAGLKIKGEITGTSDLVIDGDTQGKIRLANGRVTVGPSGRVNADIDAREIVINGNVQGNLKATESVRLGAKSQVEGSVLTPRIGIEDGARLRGNVEMTRAGETSASATSAATAEPAKATAVRAASASSRED